MSNPSTVAELQAANVQRIDLSLNIVWVCHATTMLPLCYHYATTMLPLCYHYATTMLPLCHTMLPLCYHYATTMLACHGTGDHHSLQGVFCLGRSNEDIPKSHNTSVRKDTFRNNHFIREQPLHPWGWFMHTQHLVKNLNGLPTSNSSRAVCDLML
jgi:hypothetical protein